jgi:hypothetical protein
VIRRLLELVLREVIGWPNDHRGYVQPFNWRHVQPGKLGEPLLGVSGQVYDLWVIVHEHVPVEIAFVWPWLCPVVPAVGHLCWHRGHLASLVACGGSALAVKSRICCRRQDAGGLEA